MAAAERESAQQSSTRSTGAPSHLATCGRRRTRRLRLGLGLSPGRQLGLRCRARVSPAVAAVMQPHAALDHGDLRATVGDRVVEGGEATCSSRRGASME